MSDSLDQMARSRKALAVPAGEGTWLADPPLAKAEQCIAENVSTLESETVRLFGRPLADLRAAARTELISSAFRYTSEIHAGLERPNAGALIVTGHQPELFHPGVWAKNFAAGSIAATVGGTAVNLVVDNDLCTSASVRVPVPDGDEVIVRRVFFERARPPQPWEERLVSDPVELAAFGRRVTEAMRPWSVVPVIGDVWDQLPAASEGTRLADVLTESRVRLESAWGLRNLELPVSRLCESNTFAGFAVHLLADAARFRDVHNRALETYRREHRLRSVTHPVPALENVEGWIETPFWIWQQGEHTRRRLFVRPGPQGQLALSDGSVSVDCLPAPAADGAKAIAAFRALAADGYRIRTRALTTTLFTRMFFADLFIHGIGGAGYDEITDKIISEFYGLQPPTFMTVSATLRLLGDRRSDADDMQLQALRRAHRDLQFSAEQVLATSTDPRVAGLVREKQDLIAEQRAYRGDDPERNRWRYRRFRELNKQLSACAEEAQAELESQTASMARAVQANELLQSRDYSFCLFPADRLKALFSRQIPE